MNTQALGKILTVNGHRPPSAVKPGMRYKQNMRLGRIWVVKRKVEAKTAAFPHVMIACEEFEHDTRVIAESALMDKHFFRYVPPEEKPAREEPPVESKPRAKKPAPKRARRARKKA